MQELMDEPDIALPEGVYYSLIYGDDTCLECVKCGTGNCEPMLEWLDSFYNTPHGTPVPDPLDSTCEEFVLSPYIISSESNEDVN